MPTYTKRTSIIAFAKFLFLSCSGMLHERLSLSWTARPDQILQGEGCSLIKEGHGVSKSHHVFGRMLHFLHLACCRSNTERMFFCVVTSLYEGHYFNATTSFGAVTNWG